MNLPHYPFIGVDFYNIAVLQNFRGDLRPDYARLLELTGDYCGMAGYLPHYVYQDYK